jgi:putative hydrolase of the HAD superfamily
VISFEAPASFAPSVHGAPKIFTGSARRSVSARGGGRRERRGLILDLDETLYPRETFVRSGLAAVAKHVEGTHGIPADDAYSVMVRARAEGNQGTELQALSGRYDLSSRLTGDLVDVFRKHRPSLWLSHDVSATLQRLRREGWHIAVLTNGLPSVQKGKVAALHLERMVDHVLYAEDIVPGGKPSAGSFHAALAKLRVMPQQCVCVGDDPVCDIAGARAVGISTIRLARPGVVPPASAEADLVIDSLRDVPSAAASLLAQVTTDAF